MDDDDLMERPIKRAKLDAKFSCVVPEDGLVQILSFLSIKDVSTCCLTSKGWQGAGNDNLLWSNFCDKLWEGKVYIPEKFKRIKLENPKLAYRESLLDSSRQYVTEEELSSFTWNFRFKEQAGEEWVANDPWWQGQDPITFKFFLNGSMQRCDDYKILRDVERKWRFVEECGGRRGPRGQFIRVNHYPTYIVSRHPTNWGFLMQSCWVLLTGFPLPKLGSEELKELGLVDDKLSVTFQDQWEEAVAYNHGAALFHDDNGDDEREHNLFQVLLFMLQHRLNRTDNDQTHQDERMGSDEDEDLQ